MSTEACNISIFVRHIIYSLRFNINIAFYLVAQNEAEIKRLFLPAMSYLVKSDESVKKSYLLAEQHDTVEIICYFFIIPLTLAKQAETASYVGGFHISWAFLSLLTAPSFN